METLNILDWPSHRYYGETHPFYRWRNELRNHGLKVNFYHHHLDTRLRGADYLLIHSRYFENGWQDISKRTAKNEKELIDYLTEMKASAGRVIWFDAADSSGSSDFPIIPYVDVFLKKQLLKDKTYYCAATETRDLRIWLNGITPEEEKVTFQPCPEDQLVKLKTGWNIGYNDYRYFGYKLNRLSNYLGYKFYPLKFTASAAARDYDLSFRGTVHLHSNNRISAQRNYIIELFDQLKMKIAKGNYVTKSRYWAELRNTKLSISPFGWGEICYRDFETFISGALLVKPEMDHLEISPNLYIPNETFIPVPWGLTGTRELLEKLTSNYSAYTEIAQNGQDVYRNMISDHEGFIQAFKKSIA